MAPQTGVDTVQKLTQILDSLPTAVLVVDPEGVMVLVNSEAERLFGYRRAELLGQTVDILVPARYRHGHPRLREGFMQHPSERLVGTQRDLFALRKDGVEFPVEIGLNPLRTDEGTCVVSVVVDITERKRLEALLRATVEAAPVAMVAIDKAGTMQLVNAELARLFGYRAEELLQRPVEMLIPERYRSSHPHLRDRFFAAPEARRMGLGRELAGLRRDGSEFAVEVGLNPVITEEGTWGLAAIIDLTERKRVADATLQRANDALERSNIELQRFAYVASHDLQTPMRNVASFAGLLRATYAVQLDDQGRDWIRRILESVEQLQILVGDLLDYARVDAQVHPFERIPAEELVAAACAQLENAIQEVGARVTWETLPRVLGDRQQLVLLLSNLIGNGLKYRGGTPPRIRVTAQQQDQAWLFAVRDNGIGIAPRHQQRIFDMFERLHNQQAYPGSGIGLAICRRVVHRHGGRIWVESQPGHGSTFFFTLPEPGEGTL